MTRIALSPGDGIGPEVIACAAEVLRCVRPDVECTEAPVGGAALAAGLPALPPETRALCDRSDAILFGSVGLPQYDGLPLAQRPEYALFLLRRDYELYANLRPVRVFPGLEDASSLRPEIVRGLDLIVVRELTGGIYYGQPKEQRTVDGVDEAVDTMIYRAPEIERIARIAFDLARERRKHLTSVDKQNILETSRLWRRVVSTMSAEYPDVRLEHLLVDNAAMQLVARPGDFDVIVTENMFGDILSDEAAILTGSLERCPAPVSAPEALQGGSLGSTSRSAARRPTWQAKMLRIQPRRFSRLRCCCATVSPTTHPQHASSARSTARTPTVYAPPRWRARAALRYRRGPSRKGLSRGFSPVRSKRRRFVGDLAADEIDEVYVQHGVRTRMGGAPSGAPTAQDVSLHRGDGIVVHVEVALQVEADDQRLRRVNVEAHHDAWILRFQRCNRGKLGVSGAFLSRRCAARYRERRRNRTREKAKAGHRAETIRPSHFATMRAWTESHGRPAPWSRPERGLKSRPKISPTFRPTDFGASTREVSNRPGGYDCTTDVGRRRRAAAHRSRFRSRDSRRRRVPRCGLCRSCGPDESRCLHPRSRWNVA